MKRGAGRWAIPLATLAVAIAVWAYWHTRGTSPRRQALASVGSLCDAVVGGEADALRRAVHMPRAIADRSAPEQSRWLQEVLREEVSPEGLEQLRRHGRFGPLLEIFPDEARRWTDPAGVRAEDCVAMRMERDGIRAEVVLCREGDALRVLRCNNVKQMALAKPVP